MLSRLSRKNFSLMKQVKDPTKHIFLNQGTNIHSHSWGWVGRIFAPKAVPMRDINAELEQTTVNALFSFLATQNPTGRFDPSEYHLHRSNSLGCLGVSLSPDQYDELLDWLKVNIILPTHRLRVKGEQKAREKLHESLKSRKPYYLRMIETQPLEDFVEIYTRLLEISIEDSHKGQSPGILGSCGNLDVKPSIMLKSEQARQRRNLSGNDLLEDRSENKTWINSVMAFLHG